MPPSPRPPRVFIQVVELPHHAHETTAFWDPWCVYCHEREDHPIHSKRGASWVCGYDGCDHCVAAGDPQAGVFPR